MNWKYLLILIMISFSSATIVFGRDSTRNAFNGADRLKEYFESLLELRKEGIEIDSGVRHGGNRRGNVPLYVQNVYDLITLGVESPNRKLAGRRRRNAEIFDAAENDGKTEDEVMTVQAIARDQMENAEDSNGGYLLQFNLQQLWISNKELKLAELVLAMDHTRLTAPPNSYTIYTYVVGMDGAAADRRTRLLISSEALGVPDTFGDSFVKFKVTDSVMHKVLADGPRSIIFEIVVDQAVQYDTGTGAGTRRDLTHREMADMFHLTSHGVHQPLLVLYSSTAAKIGESSQYAIKSRRRRRSVTTPIGAGCVRGSECCLHEWWIDLVELFRDQWPILMPEGFYANYCSGKCQHPMFDSRWNATGNARLRAAYNAEWRHQSGSNISNRKIENMPDATCVPQDPSPITIVYKVGERFIIRQVDGMVAHSCMCA